MREQMVRLRSTFGNEGVDESRMEPEVLKVYEKLYQVTLERKTLSSVFLQRSARKQ